MQNKTQTLTICRDGEVTHEYDAPETRTKPVAVIKAKAGQLTASARLELQMAVYDAVHGTHYRAIRRALLAEKRNREFERRIGLVPVKKKK